MSVQDRAPGRQAEVMSVDRPAPAPVVAGPGATDPACTRAVGPRHWRVAAAGLLAGSLLGTALPLQAQNATVYRCPGPPVLYTDALSPEEARDKGCRTIDGAPITIIQAPRPRPSGATGGGAAAAPASRPSEARVDAGTQRQRDSDARRILEDELRREEERLATLKRDYNNGEPERRGDERNYQRYLDRVAEMKAAIGRTERDVAAIRRELAKLPP